MSELVKVMRYEIVCPVDNTWNALGKALRDVQKAVRIAYNRTIQMAWDFQQFSFSYKNRFGSYLKFEDLNTGKSQESDIYNVVMNELPYVYSSIISAITKRTLKHFKDNLLKIIDAEMSVPSCKDDDCPIPIAAQKTKIAKDGRDYTIRIPLLAQKYAKENGLPTSFVVKVRAKGSAKAIFDRLLSGEYSLCDSQVIRDKRNKNKWYVNISYKHEVKPLELSPQNVMGVDLGVVNAAVLAYNNSPDRYYFDGSEIRAFRARIEARRNELLRQGKYCGDGRIGHGRATRLQPIEKLRGKIANFRSTLNHRYARKIVEEAIKHGCGVIQLEKLEGVNKRSTFLKSWQYDDLKRKIEYKAKEAGIEVRYIDPQYTSQRCSNCGHIAPKNRDITVSQAHFECVACGYKTNADYNAARNIATPGIEQIIQHELERVKAQIQEAM